MSCHIVGSFFTLVGKNDIKARSEKYKFELASKLSKIRDELNVKDSKIDNLLHKIGINT
jgi:hypothetical protein